MPLQSVRSCVVALAVAAGGSVAMAELSPVVFNIQANSSAGSGTWQVQLNPDAFDANGDYRWTLPDAVDIMDSNGRGTVATLSNLSLTYIADPQVNLNFVVQAGAADTTVTITSALLSFPAISPASGRASAGVTVTDTNGDGVTLQNNGRPIYLANYNGAVPGGTNFASLLTSVSAGAFSTDTDSASTPAAPGFDPIAGSVMSMSSQFQFTLTAQDSASGTSTWIVIPSPGAAGLAGLGGLVLLGRRRR